jgi:hypothetical protein
MTRQDGRKGQTMFRSFASWALLLGMMLLMVGNGDAGHAAGHPGLDRGVLDLQMSIVMSAYFAGLSGRLAAGAGDDPPGRACAGLRRRSAR